MNKNRGRGKAERRHAEDIKVVRGFFFFNPDFVDKEDRESDNGECHSWADNYEWVRDVYVPLSVSIAEFGSREITGFLLVGREDAADEVWMPASKHPNRLKTIYRRVYPDPYAPEQKVEEGEDFCEDCEEAASEKEAGDAEGGAP